MTTRNVSVTDIGGEEPDGVWFVVHDERFDISYEIAPHCDYWDFIGGARRPPSAGCS